MFNIRRNGHERKINIKVQANGQFYCSAAYKKWSKRKWRGRFPHSISMKPSALVRCTFSCCEPSATSKLGPIRQFFKTLPWRTTARSPMIQFSTTHLCSSRQAFDCKSIESNVQLLNSPFLDEDAVHQHAARHPRLHVHAAVGSEHAVPQRGLLRDGGVVRNSAVSHLGRSHVALR